MNQALVCLDVVDNDQSSGFLAQWSTGRATCGCTRAGCKWAYTSCCTKTAPPAKWSVPKQPNRSMQKGHCSHRSCVSSSLQVEALPLVIKVAISVVGWLTGR